MYFYGISTHELQILIFDQVCLQPPRHLITHYFIKNFAYKNLIQQSLENEFKLVLLRRRNPEATVEMTKSILFITLVVALFAVVLSDPDVGLFFGGIFGRFPFIQVRSLYHKRHFCSFVL